MNALIPPTHQPQPAQREALALAALARESAATGVERRVMHLKLSSLPTGRNRLHHQRLLREALLPLLRPTRARLFDLPSGDLVAVSPPPGEHLELVRVTMLKLLGEEEETASMAHELRLPQQAAALLAIVEAALGLGAEHRPQAPMRAWMQAPAANPRAGKPASVADILAAEAALARADLSVHHRWQTICALVDRGPGPQPLWREQRLAEADLAAALLPHQSLVSTPWLRRRLRARLDKRALAQWARPEELRGFSPRGLPLLPASLAEEEFLRLDALLPATLRPKLTLGFSLPDILADPESFAMARRFAGLRGYTTALDDVEAGQLPLLPPDIFGLDVLKLRFTPALLELDGIGRAALETTLPAARERVVLTGADEPIMIGWGWERGISRFQGRVIEQRLSAP
jgi:hypothetical protein